MIIPPPVSGGLGFFGTLLLYGNGTPETFRTARTGAIFHRLDGAATPAYLKTTNNAATGWLPIMVAPVTGGLTAGAVLFGGSAGNVQQNASNLFWDDTNNRLGIGNAAPAAPLHVNGNALFSPGTSIATYGDGGTPQIVKVQGSGTNYGLLSLGSATGNTDGLGGGFVSFGAANANSTDKRYAAIAGLSDGSSAVTTNGRLEFYTTSAGTIAIRWKIDKNGNLLAGTDNSWAIGGASDNRPSNIYSYGLTLANSTSALTFTASVADIVPGSTQLRFRNNLSNATNILIADSGAITFRSTVGGITTLTATSLVGALTGNADTATKLATARAINTVSFDGSADITITAAASTLTGATLASGVTASSLTSVGTLTALALSGTVTHTGTLNLTPTNSQINLNAIKYLAYNSTQIVLYPNASGGDIVFNNFANTRNNFWIYDNGGVAMNGAVNQGLGTINVTGNIFKNATQYNNPDYVFEHFFTGRIEKYKDNEGAAAYPGLTPLLTLERYARRFNRLPGIDDQPSGIFDRADIALRWIEELALHAIDHEKRLQAIGA